MSLYFAGKITNVDNGTSPMTPIIGHVEYDAYTLRVYSDPPYLSTLSLFFGIRSYPTEHAIGVDIEDLVGTTIRHLDRSGAFHNLTSLSGEIVECTTQDYDTSYLRDDWVEVVYKAQSSD